MKKLFALITSLILTGFLFNVSAQETIRPTRIMKPLKADKSAPLRSVVPVSYKDNDLTWKEREITNKLGMPEVVGDPNWTGPDPVLQLSGSGYRASEPDILQNFGGVRNSDNDYNVIPPDTDGDVGPDHYFQMVNLSFAVYDKEGNKLYGPVNNSTLWSGFTGPWTGENDGDPIILYDEQADRWIASQFALVTNNAGPYYELIAVSATGDPLGEWYRYAYEFDNMPDYPKFGIWPDAYYFTINQFANGSSFDGAGVCAVDRDAMLAGEEDAEIVFFDMNSSFISLLPSDFDGSIPPPEGSPAYMVSLGSGSQLRLWICDIDWEDPNNSSLVYDQILPVESFSNNGITIRQPGTSQQLATLANRLMFRLQYRNFGDYAAMVTNHSVNADGTGRSGIRWYELRKGADEEKWSVYQQGTYAPDDDDGRWMGSIAMNRHGDIALGYSVSGSETYPSIRTAGQTAGAPEGLGILDIPETSIYEGNASQTGGNRWGDYSKMSVDPVDDQTFWYTTLYSSGGWNWRTQIASFGYAAFPVADFISSEIIIPVGETVDFQDMTSGYPESWDWTFYGAEPSSSNERDPQDIQYDIEGSFDVQLIVANQIGTDTILREDYLTVSSTILPDVDFDVSSDFVCVNDPVTFEDMTLYAPIQWEWAFEPNTVTFVDGTDENSQHPKVTFNDAGSYTVTLTSWNLNGSSETTKQDFVIAGGYVPFFKETFENGSLTSANWTVENPDDNFTWALKETGGTEPGNMSVGIEFQEEQVIGQNDRLISPQFNLEGMDNAVLEFQHAYAQFQPGFSDSLIIYVSTDCSDNWERIYAGGEDGEGSFATHELAEGFWPETPEDWCLAGWGSGCIALDLTPYAGKSGVRIAFETYSYFGNPMFIDNVAISQFVGQEEVLPDDERIVVFPNPASDAFTITLPTGQSFEQMVLLNYLGQEVYSQKLTTGTQNIRVMPDETWSNGVYFIRLSGKGQTISRKVLIK